ncbi:MAG: hypothetical protein DCC64_11500 [Planctomycetota bacterium]|nr:MAG: hypothetical protein DCC64_11500 [Planctomycetota bacterium]
MKTCSGEIVVSSSGAAISDSVFSGDSMGAGGARPAKSGSTLATETSRRGESGVIRSRMANSSAWASSAKVRLCNVHTLAMRKAATARRATGTRMRLTARTRAPVPRRTPGETAPAPAVNSSAAGARHLRQGWAE